MKRLRLTCRSVETLSSSPDSSCSGLHSLADVATEVSVRADGFSMNMTLALLVDMRRIVARVGYSTNPNCRIGSMNISQTPVIFKAVNEMS